MKIRFEGSKDELNFILAYLSGDRREQIDEEAIRKVFAESNDAAYWKAITKALADGHDKSTILKDVLQRPDATGEGYFQLLKSKYL